MKKLKNLENQSKWLVGSGVIAAFVSSLCCIGPLVLTIFGVSGAASLSKLDEYRIPMITAVILLFGIAGYSLFRKRSICEPESICADPKKYKKMVFIYWLGFLIAILSMTSPNWIVWFF